MVGSCSNNVVKLVDLHYSQAQSSINYVIILGQHNHQLPIITSVDHKGVTCYGLRGHGVESRSLMTSVETRDLSGKADISRVISNTKRVGKSVMSMGGCLLLLRFSMKRVSIKDRDSFSPATSVSTPVVKIVVVGGERNPASLAPSFRVRGREREGKT